MRIIDVLRKHYPGTWRYEHHRYRWCGPDFDVIAYSASAARYDGDDSTFRSEYRRSDNDLLVPELLTYSRVYHV